MPVDLSFVKFPTEIPITVSSSAVVVNGDEFVRNLDLAVQFIDYIKNKYNLTFIDNLAGWMGQVYEFLGI